MKTLMVYGKKKGDERGEIKCIFGMLSPIQSCIRNAKRTAEEHGYEIVKVKLNSSWNKPFKDVTEQFERGVITE